MNKNHTLRNVLLVLTIGGVGYILWTIASAFMAGERTIAGLFNAPFTAAGEAWDAIAGMFSSSSPPPPQDITLTDASGKPIGTVLATSPLNGLFTANPLDTTAPVTAPVAAAQTSQWDTSSTLPAGWNWSAYQ